MQHFQMSGVRNQLSARGMAIRPDNGNYEVTHKDSKRWPECIIFGNLEQAYYGGLTMAAKRDRLQSYVGA